MKKCPRALRQSEIMTKESGILLKCEKRTVLPIIGGNIMGKYNAIVMPMKPMAVICIHISYKENKSAENREMIDRVIPKKRNMKDNLT